MTTVDAVVWNIIASFVSGIVNTVITLALGGIAGIVVFRVLTRRAAAKARETREGPKSTSFGWGWSASSRTSWTGLTFRRPLSASTSIMPNGTPVGWPSTGLRIDAGED